MEVWGGNREADTGVQAQGLDAWVYSRPYQPETDPPAEGGPERAGGDIYYLTSCATGRITRMLVADVSGHGEAVAEAARSLRRLLGQYANYVDQRRFVSALNRRFGDIGGAEMGLFATGIFATYFSPSDELSVCSAGHPPALRWSVRDGSWTALEAARSGGGPGNLPLGVLDTTAYAQSAITLDEGDAVLFYTDAINEASDPGGAQLGVEGLTRLINGIDAKPGDGFTRALLAGVDRYRRTGEIGPGPASGGDEPGAFDDDVTLVLVRRNAHKPRPSVGLGLTAGGRLLTGAARSIARGVAPSIPEISVRALGGAFIPGLNGRGRDPGG